ncbi:MFS transporter [Paracoccus pantotrophus]|uniref:MFS transporter n=1 Tax=Paracoccus pantotrophus TaxID=82367 RepID=UPI00048CD2E1|nr:MFS transporter [Paracoccus pantotrophus]
MAQTISVFRYKTFRMLWVGTFISNLGALIQQVGAAWLMTSLTSSPGMIALVQACVTMPIMLGSFPAGVLADCFDRRRIMLTAQIFMLIVSGLVAALAFLDMITPVSLLLFTFLIGCGTALQFPSWQSTFGELVPREELPAAISINAMGTNLTRSIGPAIGGATVALAGPAAAFALNALSYFSVIHALFRWKSKPDASPLPREAFGTAVRTGLVYCLMSPDKLRAICRGFVFCIAAIGIQALLPALVRNEIAASAFAYGVLLGAFGLGAVTAALLSDHIRRRFGPEAICSTGFLVFSLAVAILAGFPGIWLGMVTLYLAGASWLVVLSLVNISIQISTPKWVLGRMMALYMTGIFGGMTIGSWLWGFVSDQLDVRSALFLSSMTLVAGALLGRRFPLRPAAENIFAAAAPLTQPLAKLEIGHQSGPVLVTVEYLIPRENRSEFLCLIDVQRRAKLAAGAWSWILQHDIEHPETWVESYSFPTWSEYMRQRSRKTTADAEILQRILSLHEGSIPKVKRMIGTTAPLRLRHPPLL